METIKERAKEYSKKYYSKANDLFVSKVAYIAGAKEQKAIDIDKACNVFCHTGCPHKTDSYSCLKDKCDTWKRFRRMMEE